MVGQWWWCYCCKATVVVLLLLANGRGAFFAIKLVERSHPTPWDNYIKNIFHLNLSDVSVQQSD